MASRIYPHCQRRPNLKLLHRFGVTHASFPYSKRCAICLRQLQSTVIIAVIAVHVVQMTGNQVIYVIAVGHRLVSATCAMLVALFMASANVIGSTIRRIGRGSFDHVFIDMAVMQEMQVSVVQVVDVVIVLHSGMSAVGTMLMRMLLVDGVCLRHSKYASLSVDEFRNVDVFGIGIGQ